MENTIIRALYTEHRNFEHVLCLLHLCICMAKPSDPEACRLLSNAIRYLHHFQGHDHCAKEDAMFTRLLRRDASLADVHDRLREQRSLLCEQELTLLRELDRLHVGDADACKRIKEIAATYCETQQTYVALEEAHVLPVARDCLKRRDWDVLMPWFKDAADPVFGPDARKRYESPYDGLMALDHMIAV